MEDFKLPKKWWGRTGSISFFKDSKGFENIPETIRFTIKNKEKP